MLLPSDKPPLQRRYREAAMLVRVRNRANSATRCENDSGNATVIDIFMVATTEARSPETKRSHGQKWSVCTKARIRKSVCSARPVRGSLSSLQRENALGIPASIWGFKGNADGKDVIAMVHPRLPKSSAARDRSGMRGAPKRRGGPRLPSRRSSSTPRICPAPLHRKTHNR